MGARAFLGNYLAALDAVTPIIVVGLVIFGIACLLVNGGVVFWNVLDQVILRLPSRRKPDHSHDELMDGDAWARANGYAPGRLDEQTEDWIEQPPAMPPALAAHIAQRAADVDLDAEWAAISRATGGDAA